VPGSGDGGRDGVGGVGMSSTGRRTPRWWAGGLAWGLWGLVVLGWAGTALVDRLLRQAGMPAAAWLSGPAAPGVVAAVSAATVGAVLGGRRPRHPVGWLLLALGLATTFQAFATVYARHGLVARPGALPAASYLAGPSVGMFTLILSLAGFILLLTPTGSLPSPRWRWPARTVAAATALGLLAAVTYPRPLEPEYPEPGNPLSVPALEALLGVAFPASALLVLVGLLAAAGSLVGRFRHARGVERQQLRWLAFGAALAMVALLVAAVALETSRGGLFQTATGVAIALLPLATGASILRYRLYDLDRIISRTVAYGLLTVLLGVGYAGVVLGLGRLLPRGSSLVVAAATLAVAALFQPARRRVQEAVDRRFNRRRHDAAQTIAGFSARLRDELDLGTLTGELLAVVDQTMEPTRTSLWLRPQPGPGGTARPR
jgi:hypothetical protein